MIFFPSLFPVRNSGPTEFSEAEATDVVEGVDALEQDVVVPLRAELEDGAAEKVELEKKFQRSLKHSGPFSSKMQNVKMSKTLLTIRATTLHFYREVGI
jgi:hypothetical protein